MDVNFDWGGATPADLAGMFRDLEDELGDELASAADDIGLRILATAQRLAPVDRGRLRASIEHVVNELASHRLQVIVGSNVEYSPHVEFGTVKMEAQPYLRPALEAEIDWIIDRVETAVETAATNAGFNV